MLRGRLPVTNSMEAENEKESAVSLEESLEDAYTALLMREAIRTNTEVASRRMPWASD